MLAPDADKPARTPQSTVMLLARAGRAGKHVGALCHAIHRADGWTPNKLDAQLKGAFGPSFTPLDRSGDVFSWDPI